jgi:hypothetical protein
MTTVQMYHTRQEEVVEELALKIHFCIQAFDKGGVDAPLSLAYAVAIALVSFPDDYPELDAFRNAQKYKAQDTKDNTHGT